MARKNGEYIAINELYGNLSNTASISKALRYNGSLGRRVLLNGIVKFDHWITSLVVSDFSIGYEGGNVSDYIDVSSFGTDVVGENHNIGFSVNPSFISKNENNQEVSHTIEVTQFGSGEKVSVTCYQDSEAVYPTGFRYESYVSNTSIETASASGATLTLKIDGTVYIYRTYSDGSEEYYSKYDFSSVDAYVEYGYSFIGAEYSNGKVIVPSAGTDTYNGERVAFTISYYSYEVLGETYYEFPSINVYQEENKITGQEWGTSSSDYSLSISSSVSSFTSKGGTSTISVQCQQRYRDVYTSGSKGAWVWGNATASISTTYGDLSKSSITGSGTATLTVGKDYGTGTTAVVTANVGNGTKIATVSVTQAKRVEKETVYNQPTVESTYVDTAPAAGGTVYLSVDWKQSVTIVYDNDTTEDDGYVYGTSEATVLAIGNKVVTGCSVDDGGVYVPSAGSLTDSTAQKYCCNITKYSFEANGISATKSGATIPVNRQKNTYEMEYDVWVGTPNISKLPASGGTFTVSATCEERKVFTSGIIGEWTSSAAKVTKSSNIYSVSPTTFTGSATITATVHENATESNRTLKVTVAASGDSSVTDYAQVTQEYGSFEFYAINQSVSVAASTTSVTLKGVSTRNGYAEDILKGNVSVTSGTATISSVSNDDEGNFSIVVTFSANTSTSSNKTIKVKVTQPVTGSTLTYTITQSYVTEVDYIWWKANSGYWYSDAKVWMGARLVFKPSILGQTVNVNPIKNTTVYAARTFTLSRDGYDGSNYYMDIETSIQASVSSTDTFKLRAVYGSETENITLIESLEPV